MSIGLTTAAKIQVMKKIPQHFDLLDENNLIENEK